MEIHRLFENHFEKLEKAVGKIAERINNFSSKTIGTMKEFTSLSSLKESRKKDRSSAEMIKELLGDHETVIIRLRKNIDDCATIHKDEETADFLVCLMEDHETIARALREDIWNKFNMPRAPALAQHGVSYYTREGNVKRIS